MEHTPQSFDKKRLSKAFWRSPLIVLYFIFFVYCSVGAISHALDADSIKDAVGLLLTGLMMSLILAPAILVGAIIPYCHILFLGLPLFLVLKRHIYITKNVCVISGFIIGVLPIAFYRLTQFSSGAEDFRVPEGDP